jgi:hypothetical protein
MDYEEYERCPDKMRHRIIDSGLIDIVGKTFITINSLYVNVTHIMAHLET